jgi:hypothetical protein
MASVNELLAELEGTEEEKQAAKSGTASHKMTAELSNIHLLKVKEAIGTDSFFTDFKTTLTPENGQSPLQLALQAKLLEHEWHKIGPVLATTGVGVEWDYKDGSGNSGKLDLSQDLKIDSLDIKLDFQTDLSTGSTNVMTVWTYKFGK